MSATAPSHRFLFYLVFGNSANRGCEWPAYRPPAPTESTGQTTPAIVRAARGEPHAGTRYRAVGTLGLLRRPIEPASSLADELDLAAGNEFRQVAFRRFLGDVELALDVDALQAAAGAELLKYPLLAVVQWRQDVAAGRRWTGGLVLGVVDLDAVAQVITLLVVGDHVVVTARDADLSQSLMKGIDETGTTTRPDVRQLASDRG